MDLKVHYKSNKVIKFTSNRLVVACSEVADCNQMNSHPLTPCHFQALEPMVAVMRNNMFAEPWQFVCGHFFWFYIYILTINVSVILGGFPDINVK